ncbi:hypothetical protein B0J13DRAFT_47390 [Dactylonectria estremocensis]|uniref:Secreted protein n=1 Tax=Dactylonectria estremocensis TaxID=1079267 RepID=A0A9P9J5E8_9HYPO|nr:hypothetical protein B0J13DRAFT_47390 [Dactylonectria estremocensis]
MIHLWGCLALTMASIAQTDMEVLTRMSGNLLAAGTFLTWEWPKSSKPSLSPENEDSPTWQCFAHRSRPHTVTTTQSRIRNPTPFLESWRLAAKASSSLFSSPRGQQSRVSSPSQSKATLLADHCPRSLPSSLNKTYNTHPLFLKECTTPGVRG